MLSEVGTGVEGCVTFCSVSAKCTRPLLDYSVKITLEVVEMVIMTYGSTPTQNAGCL